ncbi:MAG: tetratricopeptide repeat protein [Bauldia sp.]
MTALGVVPVAAFEIKDLNAQTPPTQAFTYGLDQYNSGDKTTAAEALDFAAKNGVPGAQWKLARMYADGDGVTRDDVKAFQLFSELAAQGSDDDSGADVSAPYVSNAYVRLGTYYRQGIPNSKVKPDFGRARQAFTYAASFFGNADAQLNLARMYYNGEGGDRDLVQAAKWANLSADKGNAAAKDLAIQISLESSPRITSTARTPRRACARRPSGRSRPPTTAASTARRCSATSCSRATTISASR